MLLPASIRNTGSVMVGNVPIKTARSPAGTSAAGTLLAGASLGVVLAVASAFVGTAGVAGGLLTASVLDGGTAPIPPLAVASELVLDVLQAAPTSRAPATRK
ncbi:hypothetical protein GCM10028822_26100 [Hymenobacter terrigena]